MKKFFTAIAAVVVTGLAAQAASVSYTPQVRMNASRVGMEIIDEAPEGELTWLDRTCDGFVKKAFDATHGIVRGSVVQRVDGEDGYVYLSHMASEYPVNTWIRFEKQGDTLVMEGVQPLYVEYDYDYDEELIVYLAPMEVVVNEYNVGTFVVPEDCRYVFNIGEDGSLTSADPKMLLGVCVHTPDETVEGNDVWIWKGFGDRDISMVPASGNPVTLPEGLETYNWVMTDDYVNVFVKVAIDGDDLYVSGLDRSLPDAWVKGRIADGKAVFPSGQYLGVDMKIFYYSYFCGAEYSEETDEDGNTVQVASLTDSAVFDYDSTNGMLTLEGGYVINSTPDRIFPLYFYENVTVGEQHRNPEAAPKAPYDLEFYPDDLWGNSVFFMLPNVDVDGNILLTDNLYYEIYINGELQHFDIMDEDWNVETTVRIPYMYNDWEDFWVASDNPEDHTVYLYEDGITNIGIRSVYINENGQEIYSETAYWGDPTVGVGGLGTAPVAVKWYDLQGREINGRANGPAVKVTLFSDGSTVREKVMIK